MRTLSHCLYLGLKGEAGGSGRGVRAGAKRDVDGRSTAAWKRKTGTARSEVDRWGTKGKLRQIGKQLERAGLS